MPSRWISLGIIGLWLITTGWMAVREWIPWIIAEDYPFEVELADEAAPQHALWSLWQNDQRIGEATTTLQFRKDDTIEWVSTLARLTQQFQVASFKLKAEVPQFYNTMRLNRRGELLSIDSHGEIVLSLGFKIQAKVELKGLVKEGKLSGKVNIESSLGNFETEFQPVPMPRKSVFTPLMPLNKLTGVRPGRTWRMSRFDPLSQAITEIMQQQLKSAMDKGAGGVISLPGLPKGGEEILAEVLPGTETIEWNTKTYRCRVIQYRSEGIDAKTWVSVDDDHVIRQQASQGGMNFFLQREE
jgi:hypothetical protein